MPFRREGVGCRNELRLASVQPSLLFARLCHAMRHGYKRKRLCVRAVLMRRIREKERQFCLAYYSARCLVSCMLLACTATKAAFGVGFTKKNKDKDTTERINKAANKVIIANPDGRTFTGLWLLLLSVRTSECGAASKALMLGSVKQTSPNFCVLNQD